MTPARIPNSVCSTLLIGGATRMNFAPPTPTQGGPRPGTPGLGARGPVRWALGPGAGALGPGARARGPEHGVFGARSPGPGPGAGPRPASFLGSSAPTNAKRNSHPSESDGGGFPLCVCLLKKVAEDD